ncbi:hypothetical protein NQ317_011383, partial [Molorchus minor]
FQDKNQFILPVWRQVLWSILYAGMVIVATGGNLIVIWIVLAHKRMRTVTNYFLLNLSVADTMVSTLNVTFNFVYMLNSHWPFGELYCKITQFIAVLSISASVFSLMSISIDRIWPPLSPDPNPIERGLEWYEKDLKEREGQMDDLDNLWMRTYTDTLTDGEERVICYMEWPDGVTNESMQEIREGSKKLYKIGSGRLLNRDPQQGSIPSTFIETFSFRFNVAFLIITYVVPILSMTYTYARIGLELWGSQSIGECTQRQMDNIKSKRRHRPNPIAYDEFDSPIGIIVKGQRFFLHLKGLGNFVNRVVKMMMVVVIIFAVCWLPYQLYFIVTSYLPDITNSEYIQETYLAIYWLAMSNSMYNPIIYCWMNARFRRGFKQFFAWLPFVHVSPGALTRREVMTSKRRSYSGSPDHNRIIRNGTVRFNMYTNLTRPGPTSSADTYYTNIPDELGYSKKWKDLEMRSIS